MFGLRGERGCDGSHSRADSEGNPVTWMSSRANYRQASAGMEIDISLMTIMIYSTGTTYSLLRTMFKRARAASSIVLGSFRNFSTQISATGLRFAAPRRPIQSKSADCAPTELLRACACLPSHKQRKSARIIIPKTTHDGIIPPRRRTSVRVPRISTEICCTEAREFARGAHALRPNSFINPICICDLAHLTPPVLSFL